MGFLDKAKAAALEATAKAKEGVEDVQQKRELSQAYGELGKVAFELAESGEIGHARLEPLVAKIRSLNEREKDEPVGVGASGTTATTPEDPGQPPAMPT